MNVEESQDKLELISMLMDIKRKQKDRIIATFIPNQPSAKPFAEQFMFFRDESLTRLLRCGNRAGKTFTTMRELAWKITRTHPYRKKWNCDYDTSTPKTFWMAGPSYDFVDITMWGEYLSYFIPDWYYTDDNGKETIDRTTQKNLDTVYFKNGDKLVCKSYGQTDLNVMGYIIDDLTIDEMPRSLKLLSELMTRAFDRDGEITMGFTPLVQDEDIKDYVEKSRNISIHNWSLTANPLYRDNPEKLARALAEWENLPEPERNSRIRGDWYFERKGGRVFEGLNMEVVDDFPVPHEWRRGRCADPASHVTGFSEWAENPYTGDWYCIRAQEFRWQSKRATDLMIIEEIEKLKPYPGFLYTISLYDNAEAWFGNNGAKVGFIPCMQKNRAAAIIEFKRVVTSGKLKCFKHGGALLLQQIDAYSFKADGSIDKKKDHVLDTAMYFARQIPAKSSIPRKEMTEKDYLKASYFEQQEKKANQKEPQNKKQVYMRKFIRRNSR